MAKMKVHELAKELGIQSKEVIAFLQDKGIEVKAAQSSMDDAAVAMVKEKFAGSSAAPAQTEAPKAEVKEAEAKEVTPAEAKPETPKTEAAPVKKKKNIIIVGNPQNSKMPGGMQRPQPNMARRPQPAPARPQGATPTARPQGAATTARPQAATPAAKPQAAAPAKPVETPKPQQPEIKAQPTPTPVVQEKPKTVETPVVKQPVRGDRPQTENKQTVEKAQADRVQADRPQTDKPHADRPQQNRSQTDRPQFRQNGAGGAQDRRNDYRNNEGGNRQGNNNYQKDKQDRNGGTNGGRGYNNNDRNQRGGDRENNRFRKNQSAPAFIPDSPSKDIEKHRDEEKRRISQEKDKRSKKDLIYEEDDFKGKGKNMNKPGRFIKPEKKVEVQEEQIKVITLPEALTIKELADKMKIQPSVIIKKLFMQGQIVTVNSEISFEEAEEIAIEYEIICEKEVKVDVIEELLKEDEEAEETLVARPPVICVMGHVDHGKTSLLDAIRKTNVTDKEAGGITQHIGAYTVRVNDQKITFLDTPGHEAFTAMRMRGANATDIAILVVAADDGVMPQTVEAINHAKAAGIEIIVAVNKIDKPSANIDRVKQELAEYELIPEDWGGSTIFAPVSAKSGEGIEQLLEMILLTADILELKANPKRQARGIVIEAELDKGRGPVATILVQKGTLHVGDFISAGASHGKVRAMIDDKGRRVKEAGPSTPVEILGLSDVPNAGEIFLAHENDKTAKSFAETFISQNKEKKLEETKAKMSLDDLFSQIQAGSLKELNLIVKADVQGSVEAVKQSLLKLSNEEVVVKCIHGGVGAINESDVMLASTSQAIIIGFNVRPDATAKAFAEREGVDVRLYKVIYQAIEDIEAAMKGMLDPIFEEKVIGHAEVRQIFKASAVGNIAGSYVLDGTFQRGCKVRISREGEQIYEGELASLKRFKDDVKEVKAGYECGLVFADYDQMQELDIVEAYIMVEVPR